MHTLHIIDTFRDDWRPSGGRAPARQACRKVGEEIEIVCLDNPGEPFLKDIPCPVHTLGQSSWAGIVFPAPLALAA